MVVVGPSLRWYNRLGDEERLCTMAKTAEEIRRQRTKKSVRDKCRTESASCGPEDVDAVIERVIKRHRGALQRLAKL